jgi:NNP family nitrate/nitrite transporter-like MFS transporter
LDTAEGPVIVGVDDSPRAERPLTIDLIRAGLRLVPRPPRRVSQAFQPALIPIGTIAFLGMAALLGAASGAVFALVGKVAPADKIGTVTGVVGAAGGLGGFVPPLVMGWVYGDEHSYAIGLMLLSDVALAAAVYTAVKMSSLARRPSI